MIIFERIKRYYSVKMRVPKSREAHWTWTVKEKEFVALEAIRNEKKKDKKEEHLSLHALANKFQIERKQLKDWVKMYKEG